MRTSLGADAFVHHFFAQLDLAFRRSDPALIIALANDQCQTCVNYEKSLVAAHTEGHFLNGDSFGDIYVAVPPLQSFGVIAYVNGKDPVRSVVDARGRVLMKLKPGEPFGLEVAVKWFSGRWLVSGIRLSHTQTER